MSLVNRAYKNNYNYTVFMTKGRIVFQRGFLRLWKMGNWTQLATRGVLFIQFI